MNLKSLFQHFLKEGCHALVPVWMLAAASAICASTVWSGPLITYIQPLPDPTLETNQDRITSVVWLTRAAAKGLFNAYSETNATGLSPADTEWAFGSLANHASLNYTNWLVWLNGASPTTLVGQEVVLHLKSEDIYLSIKFTLWNQMGSGGFAYQRSTPKQPTVWNGPPISVSNATQPDMITDNVWLIRGDTQGLFNAAIETEFTHFLSPADTEWADGTTADHVSLTYTDWNTWAKILHGGPPGTVGVNAVVHLISDDIYIDITFNSWESGGSYSYQRATPPISAPSVSIVSPANGAVFASPADIVLEAEADSETSVTNVEFFNTGVFLGSALAAPFNLAVTNLPSGSYSFVAVATAGGLSSTSSVINISVINPTPLNVSETKIENGQLLLSYVTDDGLTYIVQSSSNLVDWVSQATNVAIGSSFLFSNAVSSTGAEFYRIGRLSNP